MYSMLHIALHCIATLLLNDNFSRVEYFKQITVFAMHMHNRPPRAHTILIEFTLHAIWCVCARALSIWNVLIDFSSLFMAYTVQMQVMSHTRKWFGSFSHMENRPIIISSIVKWLYQKHLSNKIDESYMHFEIAKAKTHTSIVCFCLYNRVQFACTRYKIQVCFSSGTLKWRKYIGKLPITNTKTHFLNDLNANKSSSKFPPCSKREMMRCIFHWNHVFVPRKLYTRNGNLLTDFRCIVQKQDDSSNIRNHLKRKGLVRRYFITFWWKFEDYKTQETFNFELVLHFNSVGAENASISLQLKPFATCLELETATCEQELESFYSLWFWKLRWFGR